MRTTNERADRVWIAGSMAVAAAVALLCTLRAPLPFMNDSMIYLSLGEHLAAGAGYHSSLHLVDDLIQPPLFPFAIALGTLVTTPLRAAIAITAMAWALTIPALVSIHTALWGKRGSRIVAASLAVYPMLALSALLLTEPPFVCLTCWAVAFGIAAAQSSSLRPAALSGVFLGLSILTRPEGILTVAILGVLLLVQRRSLRDKLTRLGAAAAMIVTLLGPYGVFLRSRVGHFTVVPKLDYNRPYAQVLERFDWPPDQKAMPARDQRAACALMPDHKTFVFSYALTHPEFDARTVFPLAQGEGVGAKVRDVVSAARRIVWTGAETFGFWNPVAVLLALVALSRLRRQQGENAAPRRDLVVAVLALVAAFLLPALSSALNFEFRFLAVSSVLSLVLVGGGIAPVTDWITRRLGPRWAPAIGVLLIASYGIFLTKALPFASGNAKDHERTSAIGEACERTIPSGVRVLDLNARCAFLTHGWFFAMPYVERMETLTDYVTANDIDYALLDEDVLTKHPSAVVRALRDPETWPPSWKVESTLRWSNGTTTRIAKLKPRGQ